MTLPEHQDRPTLSPFSRGWNAYCRGEEDDWRPAGWTASDAEEEELRKGWHAASNTKEGRQHRAVAIRLRGTSGGR